MQSVRSLIVAGSLLLSAVAIVPAQQPAPVPAPAPRARARGAARPQRGKQFDKALLRGVTLSDAEKTNLQAVRAKYAAQRGDTAALRSMRASFQTERQTLAQAERNDVRNALTPANQAKFDSNLKRVEARAARKPFKARRLSNR